MDFLSLLHAENKINYIAKNNLTVLCFREIGCVKVDFYPSTNKWKYSNNKIMYGDAKRFYNWYRKYNFLMWRKS